MIRFLLSAVILLTGVVAMADTSAPDKTPTTPVVLDEFEPEVTLTEGQITSNDGVTYTEDRLMKLPQDGNKLYVTVFGNPDNATTQKLVAWFNEVPELKDIKRQVWFNKVSPTEKDFSKTYSTVKKMPCVIVTTPRGARLYDSSVQGIPMSGVALAKSINSECLRRWRNHEESNPDKAPPDDDADGDPSVDEGDHSPVIDQEPAPDSTAFVAVAVAIGLLGICFVIGICIGFVKDQAIRSHTTR